MNCVGTIFSKYLPHLELSLWWLGEGWEENVADVACGLVEVERHAVFTLALISTGHVVGCLMTYRSDPRPLLTTLNWMLDSFII